MDTNIKNLENCKRELEAALEYHELIPHFEKALADYKKNVTIPGFRKGKAPLQMIKKMYGEAIEYRALEDIANNVFRDFIVDNKVPMIGTGSITDLDYKPGEKMIFKVEYEIKPDIQLENYKDIELTKVKYIIDNSLVDDELQYLKFKNAAFELDGQALDTEYMITVDTNDIDESGNVIDGKDETGLKFYLGSPYLAKEYADALTGIKENEEKIIETKDKQGEARKLKLKCVKIEKIIYPEMNEESFKKFTGKDDIKSEDDLMIYLKDEISKAYNDMTEQSIRSKVVQEIVKLNEVSVPDRYVDAILQDYVADYKKQHAGHKHEHEFNEEEFIHQNRADAVFSGKWFLIKEKLIEIEKIEVNDDDIMKFSEESAKNYNIPAEKLFEIYSGNEEIKNTVLNRKVIDFLIENAKITEKEEIKKSIAENAKTN
ncbi:MAG: Trigger factor [Bacteroidota bacterium]|nr:Trigger factor [Bacteroidota bacterium]